MEEQDLFRTVIFGGYQKEDVQNYIYSLQDENRVFRLLSNKEKNELKEQLKKTEALNVELKHSLTALQNKIEQLEMEREALLPREADLSCTNDYSSRREEIAGRNAASVSMEKEALENHLFWTEDMIRLLLGLQKQYRYWQDELKNLRHAFEHLQKQLNVMNHPDRKASSPDPLQTSGNAEFRRSKPMDYPQKLDVSVTQTRKRISDLLQALEDF